MPRKNAWHTSVASYLEQPMWNKGSKLPGSLAEKDQGELQTAVFSGVAFLGAGGLPLLQRSGASRAALRRWMNYDETLAFLAPSSKARSPETLAPLAPFESRCPNLFRSGSVLVTEKGPYLL